jgi:2-iminobutanoate/2-iminopropanoate deaminase
MRRRRVIELPGIKHRAPIPTAVVIDNVLASSAVFGADTSGELPESLDSEIANVFGNIKTVLDLAGAATDDVLQMDVLVRESGFRDIVNKYWLMMFPDPDDRPARHITVVDNLPARAQVQFLAVLPAALQEDGS